MLKINNIKMNLDLTVIGTIRQGHILCNACTEVNASEIGIALKKRQADRLLPGDGSGHCCDNCGVPLERQFELVLA